MCRTAIRDMRRGTRGGITHVCNLALGGVGTTGGAVWDGSGGEREAEGAERREGGAVGDVVDDERETTSRSQTKERACRAATVNSTCGPYSEQ